MKDLTTFATEEYPLHPSQAAALLACNWRMAFMHLFDPTDASGPAADTGSAVHAAAAQLHKGGDTASSLGVMQAGLSKYPLADLQDAAGLFLLYASDPRNREAKFAQVEGRPFVERQVKFEIAPAPEDPTGGPIVVLGTVDQVRLHDDGRLRAWDIKTSKLDPMDVLHATTFQMALYCVGASILLNRRVDPGGIIMPRRYTKDVANSPAFWHFAWTFDDVEQIVQPIRKRVAEVRAWQLHHVPNKDCRWCAFRTPDVCLPELKKTLQMRVP